MPFILKRFNSETFNLSEEATCLGSSLPSPSRFLCDLFWKELDWESLRTELGSGLNVLDIGAGSGSYALKLDSFSGGLKSYIGIDAFSFDTWFEISKNPVFKFINDSADNLYFHLEKHRPNLIISQSSLEHIQDDLFVFEQISKYASSKASSLIQIHLVPAASCLGLYGEHGVRQYTISSIQRLISAYNSTSSIINVFPLGGPQAIRIHSYYINNVGPFLTKKRDVRAELPHEYTKNMLKAVKSDLALGVNSNNSFYAIVIKSIH